MTGFAFRPDRGSSGPAHPAAAAVWAAVICALAGQTTPSARAVEAGREGGGDRDKFRLIADYLPNILYTGDDLTVCLRAENASGRKAPLSIALEFQEAGGKRRRPHMEEGECPLGGFLHYRRTHEIGGAVSFSYTLKVEGREVARHTVRIVRPEDAFPVRARSYSFDAEGAAVADSPDPRDQLTHARAGGIWDEVTGERLLFLIAPRLRKEDRRWAPLRWMFGEAGTSRPPGRPAVFVPEVRSAGPAGGASLAALLKSKAGVVEIVELPPPSPLGAEPVLETACRVCAWMESKGKNEQPDRVVALLPIEDAEWATGPREYRLALELLLSRLETMGAPGVALAPPVSASVPRKRLDVYRTQIRETVTIYGQSFADTEKLLADEYWRAAEGVDAVLGEKMNSKGIERLADELLKWVR
ncbi:MAG: hypothetical protein N3A38_14785 [Planctomycetota bacterium]|nr:hypothetical protein [Planctomycetota bacterium]